jgi:hypothetical protein
MTRRDDREYREYLREEQRSQRGCIAGRTGSPTRQPRWGPRMQLDFYHGLLFSPSLHSRVRLALSARVATSVSSSRQLNDTAYLPRLVAGGRLL